MIVVDETEPEGELPPPFPPRYVEVKVDVEMRKLYELKKEIGRGRFGTVYLCYCNETGQKFAAKFVNTRRNQDRQNVEREIEIMKILNSEHPHPRLIQLYDAFDMGKEMCLVLEVVDGGELFERVIDDDFVLTEKAGAIFIRQICEGVSFIHSKNILHLDMKPENILCLSREGNRVKICDFGLARKYDPRKKLQVLFGTPEFVAPEVVNFEPISFGTDMWSVGVICYVLLSGLSPFMGHNYVETMTNVTHNKYDFDDEVFDDISDEAKDFIQKLLILDKSERLTPDQCLRHKWLRRQPDINIQLRELESEGQYSVKNISEDKILELTKQQLKEFIERWNSHPNSPYSKELSEVSLELLKLEAERRRLSRSSFVSIIVCPPSEYNEMISELENEINEINIELEPMHCVCTPPFVLEQLHPEEIVRQLQEKLNALYSDQERRTLQENLSAKQSRRGSLATVNAINRHSPSPCKSVFSPKYVPVEQATEPLNQYDGFELEKHETNDDMITVVFPEKEVRVQSSSQKPKRPPGRDVPLPGAKKLDQDYKPKGVLTLAKQASLDKSNLDIEPLTAVQQRQNINEEPTVLSLKEDPVQPEKNAIYRRTSREITPEVGEARRRKISRCEKPSRESGQTTPVKGTHRRPSRDAPLSSAQLERLTGAVVSAELSIPLEHSLQIWPDIIAVPKVSRHTNEGESPDGPIPKKYKLEIPLTAIKPERQDIYQPQVTKQEKDSSQTFVSESGLKFSISKVENETKQKDETISTYVASNNLVEWILDVDSSLESSLTDRTSNLERRDTDTLSMSSSDEKLQFSRNTSPRPLFPKSRSPSPLQKSCNENILATSHKVDATSIESCTIKTPWGPLKRSPSRSSFSNLASLANSNIACTGKVTKETPERTLSSISMASVSPCTGSPIIREVEITKMPIVKEAICEKSYLDVNNTISIEINSETKASERVSSRKASCEMKNNNSRDNKDNSEKSKISFVSKSTNIKSQSSQKLSKSSQIINTQEQDKKLRRSSRIDSKEEGEMVHINKKKTQPSLATQKKQLSLLIFSAQDRISQFEKKKEEKLTHHPLTRTRTGSLFPLSANTFNSKEKLNKNSSVCDENKNPVGSSSKTNSTHIEFMRSRLLDKASKPRNVLPLDIIQNVDSVNNNNTNNNHNSGYNTLPRTRQRQMTKL